ncbi:hypothetical protein B0O80DRAFT_534262 [Mortierella sp. GBAus27b]|nr:hypothetical protein B0O80DRAFT_534262 [Mortierella sp. GBAus27b]
MAHIPHALGLPEITFRVAQYLDRDDFTACSLVCKSFYASFASYLWENIRLGVLPASEKKRAQNQEPLAKFISPDAKILYDFPQEQQSSQQHEILQLLHRIAPWIRSLSLYSAYFAFNWTPGDQCNNLHSLLLSLPTFAMPSGETSWNACEALVRQNSNSLRSLTLIEWRECFGDSVRPIWSPLHTCAQHSNLTTLKMQRGTLRAQDLEAFLTICQQLEILELTAMDMTALLVPSNESSTQTEEGVHHENRPSLSITSAAVRFPKLRELTLDKIKLIPKYLIKELILHCPMLHTLVWRLNGGMFSLNDLCDYFEAQSWPYLDSLVITGHSNVVHTQEHIRFLQSIKRPFKLMDLCLWALTQRSFDLLREGGHFETLTKINLTTQFMTVDQQESIIDGTQATASKRIIEVLESCPSLEHIVAKEVKGQDIIDSKPWACHRLKTFEVLISMDLPEQSTTRVLYTEDEKRQCHQVFERLSQLRRLKVLNMRNQYQGRCLRGSPVCIPLDLRMGLGRLSTLRDLEWIGYQGPQNMRMVDVEWMLQHWSRLRKMTGRKPALKRSKTFGGTSVRCYLLRKALMARKVDVPMEWMFYVTNVERYMKSNGLETVYDTDDDDEG